MFLVYVGGVGGLFLFCFYSMRYLFFRYILKVLYFFYWLFYVGCCNAGPTKLYIRKPSNLVPQSKLVNVLKVLFKEICDSYWLVTNMTVQNPKYQNSKGSLFSQ